MFFPNDPLRNTICWIIGIAIILFTVWMIFVIIAGCIELDREERRNKGKTDLSDVLWWINTFGFCPYSLSDHDEEQPKKKSRRKRSSKKVEKDPGDPDLVSISFRVIRSDDDQLLEEDSDDSNRTSGKPRKPGPASLPSSDSPAPEEEQDPQTISYPKAWVSTSEAKEASPQMEKS